MLYALHNKVGLWLPDVNKHDLPHILIPGLIVQAKRSVLYTLDCNAQCTCTVWSLSLRHLYNVRSRRPYFRKYFTINTHYTIANRYYVFFAAALMNSKILCWTKFNFPCTQRDHSQVPDIVPRSISDDTMCPDPAPAAEIFCRGPDTYYVILFGYFQCSPARLHPRL